MTYEKFVEDNSLNYRILEMKLSQGKSYSEIANNFNRSKSTVRERYQTFSWSLYRCYLQYLESIGINIDSLDIINFYNI